MPKALQPLVKEAMMPPPKEEEARAEPKEEPAGGLLGQPLSLLQVARLIGCSAWTVRHRLILQGLPHFRSGPSGKLIFYRHQVTAWILQQQKGGKTK